MLRFVLDWDISISTGFIIDVTASGSMAFLILGIIQAAGGALWLVVIMTEWYRDASKRICIPWSVCLPPVAPFTNMDG